MQGILLIDKPAGWTSFDVVNKIRYQVAREAGVKPKSIKVGHAGTLDPFATGLLIVLVGKEHTRQAQKYAKQDKTYEVEMVLGKSSSTGDPDGEISVVGDIKPDKELLMRTLKKFKGEISQVPHPFSAIKIDGQRAYKLAREGRDIKLEPRKVTISQLELVSYDFPTVKFIAEVSSGTYIRSLVEDIGGELGTGAYTANLRRIKIGDFDIADAKPVEQAIMPE